jgi:hypothetical protein
MFSAGMLSMFGLAIASVPFDTASSENFANLALECVHREYPNKIAHVMQSDADARPPRELTPVFFGCFDWHSAVHGHWLLARLARTYPTTPLAETARAVLDQSFTPEKIAAEVRYLEGPGRNTFERPYGLAWLLQLSMELREWQDSRAQAWAAALAPLEKAAAKRLSEWLPKLSRPIRVGEHDQTAFAMGLALDWARATGSGEMAVLIEQRAKDYYLADKDCPLEYEPSGQDFFSPCLAEADLMRRVLPSERYGPWLREFLPGIPRGASKTWLEPAVVTDRADGKLVHLDGLNLSRAWMLEGIAAGLPAGDKRIPALSAAAATHRQAGLAAVSAEHYEGGHWLGTFAVYLVTGRGLPAAR